MLATLFILPSDTGGFSSFIKQVQGNAPIAASPAF